MHKYFSDIITLGLTNLCNLLCTHCYRPKMENKFSLTDNDINLFLKDLDFLFSFDGTKKIYLTGGEPFLWKTEARTLHSLMVELSEHYATKIAVDTNGTGLASQESCDIFVTQMKRDAGAQFKLCLSIDQFHTIPNNTVDSYNVLEYLRKSKNNLYCENLNIEALTVFATNTDTSYLIKIQDFCASLGVTSTLVPLYPALGISVGIIPRLAIRNNNNKPCYSRADLGNISDFGFFPEASNQSLTNETLLKLYHRCTMAPVPLFCWNRQYWWCLPQCHKNKMFSIGKLGELKEKSCEFFDKFPHVLELKKYGIFEYIERNKFNLESLFTKKYPIRFSGCALCVELFSKLKTNQTYPFSQ